MSTNLSQKGLISAHFRVDTVGVEDLMMALAAVQCL